MFDTNHILYMIISALITVEIFILAYYLVDNENKRQKFLRFFAIATVLLHYSSVYTTFLTTGIADLEDSMLFPIYPCNVAMWLLLLTSFMKKKEGRLYKVVSEFTFYLGIVGGIVGIVFNENYGNTPNLLDWEILKGLLSHSTMLVGAIYLLVGRFIKIRVSNVLSVIAGLVFLVFDGFVIISIFTLAGIDAPNCMYLLENPFPSMPNFSTFTIGIIAVAVAFVITSIVEFVKLEKENRWYYGLFKKIEQKLKTK